MIKGHWEPQTEEEAQLLRDLHVVTRAAHQEGVPVARIASLLGFMASAGYQGAHFEETRSRPAQSDFEQSDPDSSEQPLCPECGEPIEDVGGSLGRPIADPCSHIIEDRNLVREVINDGS